MVPGKPKRLARPALLLLLLTFLAAVGGSGPSGEAHSLPQTHSVSYQDRTGEDPDSLDLGRVIVANDDAGRLTFGIRFVNREYNDTADCVWVALDVDRNPATGDIRLGGAEWTLDYVHSRAALKQWRARKWVDATRATTVDSRLVGSLLILSVSAREIGSPDSFAFKVGSMAAVPITGGIALDSAPDWGKRLWRYDVKISRPELAASRPTCTPDPPAAGKPLTIRMTVKVYRGDAAEPLGKHARVIGRATVAGIRLAGKVAPNYSRGRIAVTFTVPEAAGGKLLRGILTVTRDGATVRRTLTERVG